MDPFVHKTLTMEAMKDNGWNAIALPIPIEASRELLIEVYSWACHFIQVYGDEIRDNPPPHNPEDKENLRLSERRAVQAEWRLNVMGLFQEWPRDWKPVEDNRYVRYLIERMAKPDDGWGLP